MYCSNCGVEVNLSEKYCLRCGKNLHAPIVKKRSLLFKCTATVIGLGLFLFAFISHFEEDFTKPIEEQLISLRENKISQAYYKYTSKEFQESTSLEDFRDFMKHYPELSKSKAITYTESLLYDQIGILNGTITSTDNHSIPVEYYIVKEGDQWKINSIELIIRPKLEKNPVSFKSPDKVDYFSQIADASGEPVNKQSQSNAKPNKPFEIDELIKLVQDQYTALSKQDYSQAYQAYMSKDFKTLITVDEFKKYIQQNPLFSDRKTFRYTNLMVQNNIATLKGFFISNEDEEFPVSISFVSENGQWKILHEEILKPEKQIEQEKMASFQFVKAVFGSQVDSKGTLIAPKEVIKSDLNTLYVNLYIKNAINGMTISAQLKNEKKGLQIKIDSIAIQGSGDANIPLQFSPPANGWPKGDYQLILTSSNNVQGNFTVKVE